MITRLTASLRQVSRLHCQSELPSIRPASRLNLLRNNIYSTKNPRRMISSTSTFNNATENIFIHQELPTMTPLKAFKLLSVSLLGISLGSLLAVKFTEILDLTGLFHYVPEDDDDEDEEESGENGKTERKKSDQAKIIQVIGMLDKEENQFTRKLAMESTGDITLNMTINMTEFDIPSRSFQLLQLKSFLANLESLSERKDTIDEESLAEIEFVKKFVRRSVTLLEARLEKEKKKQMIFEQ